MMYYPRRETRRNPWLLTPREWQVVELVCRGIDSYVGMAAALTISQKTVQTHLHSVYGKLGIDSPAKIVLRVMHDSQARERCFPSLLITERQTS